MAQADADLGGAGVLGGVGEQFRDGEVTGRLDGGRQPAGEAGLHVDVEVAVEGERAHRVAKAAVGEDRRQYAVDELAQVLEGPLGGGPYLVQQGAGGRQVVVEEAGCLVESHAEGDEPGLRPVVQVPFDAP